MARSKASYSAASKRGWKTRRANAAKKLGSEYLLTSRGVNKRRGKAIGYILKDKVTGKSFEGQRFDFRGLTPLQIKQQLKNVLKDVVGKRLRLQMMTTTREQYSKLIGAAYQIDNRKEYRKHANQDPNKPYFFWLPLTYEIESSGEAFDYMYDKVKDSNSQNKIVVAEVI